MSKLDILNLKGEKVKDTKLNDNVFGIEPNDSVIYDAVVLYNASQRQGTHSTKTRSEVSGGGRKPWRQKGTGNARQGSIRAVQWRHGGIAHGPKPRDYSKKMNKKERRLALKSALSYKAKDKDIILLENISMETNKTKDMLNILNTLNIADYKLLLIVNELTDNVCLSARNLGNVKIVLPTEVNTYDVMNADKLVITMDALQTLEEVLTRE
ncbi:MAG: 50S ribosomal protein L4 [Bacilli bacterium]|nr:50S ribosomal protein L4 [Clostridium sp.]MDY3798605.1 50S ribosomal protein L4 [Bacilli bacterium]CDE95096.1 50S ribosomal protein L4 [Clostridium sp. CAG:914]